MAKYSKTRWAKMVALGEMLIANHPRTFIPVSKGSNGLYPLKIGITKEILALYPDVDPVVLGSFMENYASAPRYLEIARRAGMPRVDLDGHVASVISPAEARNADRNLEFHKRVRHQDRKASVRPDGKTCERTGKTKFKAAFEANQAMERTHSRSGTANNLRGSSFKCGHCGFYHWGRRDLKGVDRY